MKERVFLKWLGVGVMCLTMSCGYTPGCSVSFPPLRYVFLFTNTEDKFGAFVSPVNFRAMSGVHNIGASLPGLSVRIYSNLGDGSSHLQVYDPESDTYINVDADPVRTRALIRDYHLVIKPITQFQKVTLQVDWEGADTQFPVYRIPIHNTAGGGRESVYLYRIKGTNGDLVGAGARTTMRIVDGNGNVVADMDRSGRELLVRIGDSGEAGNNPVVVSTAINTKTAGIQPLSLTPPGPLAAAGALPQVTVDHQLSLVDAQFYQSTGAVCRPGASVCLYDSGPVGARVLSETRNPDGTWLYIFQPVGELVPGLPTLLAIITHIQENSAGRELLPPSFYQAGTQDMHGNLLCDTDFTGVITEFGPGTICQPCVVGVTPGGPPGAPGALGGCDLGTLRSDIQNFIMVLPYFYITDPPAGQEVIPLPPWGNLLSAQVVIKPEAFHKNTGVFTAFVSLPENFDSSTVETCIANGASAFAIIKGNCDSPDDDSCKNFIICKFNRSDIQFHIEPDFVVTGTTSEGYTFIGYDRIKKVVP